MFSLYPIDYLVQKKPSQELTTKCRTKHFWLGFLQFCIIVNSRNELLDLLYGYLQQLLLIDFEYTLVFFRILSCRSNITNLIFHFKYYTKLYTLIFGGISTKIWTWSLFRLIIFVKIQLKINLYQIRFFVFHHFHNNTIYHY